MDPFIEITKPTLLLNSERSRRNIQWMAARAREQGIHFRPHFKTHQSTVIGEWFRTEGVHEITVSSVDMAGYFADNGWRDITLAFPVNLRQMDEIQALAERVDLGLLVESREVVAQLGRNLSSPVKLWLKVDTGLHRAGLPWDQVESFTSIIEEANRYKKLKVFGLLTHAGNTYHAQSTQEIIQIYHQTEYRMNKLRNWLADKGWGEMQVSIGDTPGCSLVDQFGSVDEIRPGNFVFYDAQQYSIGACHQEQIATAVACPVVAIHPERNEIVIYGGAIHFSKDWVEGMDSNYFGMVAWMDEKQGWSEPIPGARVTGLSQEHGIIQLPGDAIERIQPGDLICVIPPHICLVVQAMGRYRTLDGEWIDIMPS